MQNKHLLRQLAEHFCQRCSKYAVATKCSRKTDEAIAEIVVAREEQAELIYTLRVTTVGGNINIQGWSSFSSKKAMRLAKSCVSDIDPDVPKSFYSDALFARGRVALATETSYGGSLARQKIFNALALEEMQNYLADIASLVFETIKPKYAPLCSFLGIIAAGNAGTIGVNHFLKGALLALAGQEGQFNDWSKAFLSRPIEQINSQHYVNCLRQKIVVK
jgi:hypothetical protein